MHLYLCPPAEKIYFENNFSKFPAKFLGFEVKPNYDGAKTDDEKAAINKMVNNF